MNQMLVGVGVVGLALGFGMRYSLVKASSDTTQVSEAPEGGDYRVVRRIAPRVVSGGDRADSALFSHGPEGPIQVHLEPSAIVQNSQAQQGIQLTLTIDNEEDFWHLVRYAVEVVDAFDAHYVGPQQSENYRAGKTWTRSIEIPPGLPDGVYYLRVTVAGVGQDEPAAKEPGNEVSTEFSVAKRVYFALAQDQVELLDWSQYQQRLTEAAGPVEGGGNTQ